jgi:phage gpG-like protein
MSKSNKFDLKQSEKKARKAMEAAIVDVGNTAKVFFVQSFRKQGWDDKAVEKWKPRKKKTYKTKSGKTVDDTTRATLVKTGDLRRSIIRDPANRAALSIKIHSDLDYAKIHNDGLMGRAWGRHTFKMPKRQFMGDSYNLNEQVKKVIVKRLDKIFK